MSNDLLLCIEKNPLILYKSPSYILYVCILFILSCAECIQVNKGWYTRVLASSGEGEERAAPLLWRYPVICVIICIPTPFILL